MAPDDRFERLAQRHAELHSLGVRGRRRTMVLLALSFVPLTILVMAANDDWGLAVLLPMVGGSAGALGAAWHRWRHRPEDAPSVLFLGLDRPRRQLVYRSLRDGTSVDDRVVLTVVESLHDHLRRSATTTSAVMASAALLAVALPVVGGAGAVAWPIGAAVIAALVAGLWQQRWMTRQTGLVVTHSRGPERA